MNMKNRIEIKIYRLKEDINLPIASEPNKYANCSIGDFLICFDNKHVFATDWNDNITENFVLLLNDLSFIENNSHIFEQLT